MITAIGCSHNVQIPPSRPMALETPAIVKAGERRGGVQVARHGTIFDGSFDSGTLRLRSGFSERVEIDLDGSVIDPESSPCRGYNIFLGRVGLKLAPLDTDNFALTAGVGGGYAAAAGKMLSTDVGLMVGFHNRYVVPYLGASTFVSVPIEARPVRTGSDPEDVDTPSRTAGAQVTVGLALVREDYTLSLGGDSTVMYDADGEQHVLSVGLAFEIPIE